MKNQPLRKFEVFIKGDTTVIVIATSAEITSDGSRLAFYHDKSKVGAFKEWIGYHCIEVIENQSPVKPT